MPINEKKEIITKKGQKMKYYIKGQYDFKEFGKIFS